MGHSKQPLQTTQETTLHMDITLDGKYRNKIDYIFVAKDGKAL